MKNESKKVLGVCSYGGHFVQMSLIAEYVSLPLSIVTTKKNGDGYFLRDYNKSNAYMAFFDMINMVKIMRFYKPSCVLSTGAAPGLFFLLVAKAYGKKTIWIDSVANSRKLSLSGKMASIFCDRTLSQWEEVARKSKRVKYIGEII